MRLNADKFGDGNKTLDYLPRHSSTFKYGKQPPSVFIAATPISHEELKASPRLDGVAHGD